jgi:FkbM family methyltransferase
MRAADLTSVLASPSESELEFARIYAPNEALVIFDIGACEGEDSIRFARHYPRATVFSFEPLPANAAIVRHNLQVYGAASVRFFPIALSDRSGEATFHVSSGTPPSVTDHGWNFGNKSSSLLAPSDAAPMHGWVKFNERIAVPTQTLDEFCRAQGIDHIDFIQMDVQGAERLVLNGATEMLPRITAIWLEVACCEHYRGQPLAADMERFMRQHGFRLAHASYRDPQYGEGDHLYLNMRCYRTWRHLVIRKIQRIGGSMRRGIFGRASSP